MLEDKLTVNGRALQTRSLRPRADSNNPQKRPPHMTLELKGATIPGFQLEYKGLGSVDQSAQLICQVWRSASFELYRLNFLWEMPVTS
jgi:hypothetical protein